MQSLYQMIVTKRSCEYWQLEFCPTVSKTIEELRLEWKTMNPVIMGKGLRMPQFEIVDISASVCQESFQIGEFSLFCYIYYYYYLHVMIHFIYRNTLSCLSHQGSQVLTWCFLLSKFSNIFSPLFRVVKSPLVVS